MTQENLPEKFSSVDDLIKAYKQLEGEFTKRNNELKSLKAENEELKNTRKVGEQSETKVPMEQEARKQEAYKPTYPDNQADDERTQIKVFSGGTAVRTLPFKPKTLAEANALAQQFLKGE